MAGRVNYLLPKHAIPPLHPCQAKAAEEAERARQAAEGAAYGRAMGSFLNAKGREEVEEFRRRKEEERERVAYARSRLDAKGFSSHRY